MSLSRAAGSKMASALVLMLCAALFAVLRVGADTIRAREVPGAGDPDTLASATIEWAESRPFDQSGIDARFVSVLAESDGVERLAGQTSLELGARSAGRELKARIVLVQGNLFETLGVRLATGTSKTSAREAVISDAFWRRAFDGRPDIIGLQFQLHGRSMNDDPWTALTVVGWRRRALPAFARTKLRISGCRGQAGPTSFCRTPRPKTSLPAQHRSTSRCASRAPRICARSPSN